MNGPEFLSAFQPATGYGLGPTAWTPQSFIDSRSLLSPAQYNLPLIRIDIQLGKTAAILTPLTRRSLLRSRFPRKLSASLY
jgi:hypothetical protein